MTLNRTNQITTLTALRGIAALFVAGYHFNQYVLPVFNSQWTLAHLRGYLWADFFFILSGFIMTYVVVFHLYGAHSVVVFHYVGAINLSIFSAAQTDYLSIFGDAYLRFIPRFSLVFCPIFTSDY